MERKRRGETQFGALPEANTHKQSHVPVSHRTFSIPWQTSIERQTWRLMYILYFLHVYTRKERYMGMREGKIALC